MVAIILPDNYGCVSPAHTTTSNNLLTTHRPVIGVALGAIPFLGFIHGGITTKTRKAANIPYPHSYATVEQCKSNVCPTQPPLHTPTALTSLEQPKAEQFNCAQRAHSNFLENSSQTMLTTLVAGLKYPQLAAGLATAWVAARMLFLYGYVYSGKPQGKGRMLGGFFWLFQGGLWALTLGVAKDLVNF